MLSATLVLSTSDTALHAAGDSAPLDTDTSVPPTAFVIKTFLPLRVVGANSTMMTSAIGQTLPHLLAYALAALGLICVGLVVLWAIAQRRLAEETEALHEAVTDTDVHGASTSDDDTAWQEQRKAGPSAQIQELTQIVNTQNQSLKDAARAQQSLLDDTHHRMDNNLQLISSMIDLQMRRMENAPCKDVLKQLQDRVTALATIHASLRKSGDLKTVDIAPVLTELSSQIAQAGAPDNEHPMLDVIAEQISLPPDRALPLALLACEALTNALKHSQMRDTGPHGPEDRVRLRLSRDFLRASATLEITNPCTLVSVSQDSPGIGRALIRAFAAQLKGDVTQAVHQRQHILRLTFPVALRGPDPTPAPDAAPQTDTGSLRALG